MRPFFLLLLLYASMGSALLNLEEKPSSFVLETKQIEIPGYPDAFNASIVRWQDAFLMSFRIIPERKSSYTSFTGLVWLDENFSPRGEPQILNSRMPDAASPSRMADARLIEIGERLYIVYEDNIDSKITRGGFRVFVGEIKYDGHLFSIENIDRLSRFAGENPQKREKSWVPFGFEHTLLLAYSLEPHLIFRPLLSLSACESIASTYVPFNWDFGIVRGGTPALEVDGRYLAFFHSVQEMETVHSKGQKALHYFLGAYTFEASPPFQIDQISCEPIIAEGFYRNSGFKPYWHPVRAIFPCGYVVVGDAIWVSYGREDHEIWLVKLDKAGLMESLRSITSFAQ